MKLKGRLNVLRYLTFELGRACDLAHIHKQCPSAHPERYRLGKTACSLTDDIVMDFWQWCRYAKGFRGIVLWQGYNEPTLQAGRIFKLMDRIKCCDPYQPFRLLTNKPPTAELEEQFDMIKFTDYSKDPVLDNRIASITGEGKPYNQVQKAGWCGRGWGYEIIIDNYGNWNLCCNDWRCEESVGNVFNDNWEELLKRFEEKARKTRWNSEETYNALPRMCRACMDVNFNLHRSGCV